MSYNFAGKMCVGPIEREDDKKNYYGRTSRRLSDIMRRVRERWELQGIRPNWIGKEVFEELLKYLESPEFLIKSENFKKMRTSEKGDFVNAVGSISST